MGIRKEYEKTSPAGEKIYSEFYQQVFGSKSKGYEFALGSFPYLYSHTIHEVKNKFDYNELRIIVSVFKNLSYDQDKIGQETYDRLILKLANFPHTLLKIKSLSLFESACLEIWAISFHDVFKGDLEDYIL